MITVIPSIADMPCKIGDCFIITGKEDNPKAGRWKWRVAKLTEVDAIHINPKTVRIIKITKLKVPVKEEK